MAKTDNGQKKNAKSTKKTTAKSTKTVAAVKKAPTTKSVKKSSPKTTVKAKKQEKVIKAEVIKEEKTEVKSTKKARKKSIFSKAKDSVIKNWNERKEFVIACIIIAILAIVIILLACAKRIPKTKNGEEVLASINGLTITSDKLYTKLKESYGTNDVINLIDEYIANDYVKKLTKDDEKYIDQVVDYYKQYADYYGTSFEDFLAQYVGISGVTNEKQFREYVTKDYKKTLAVKKYLGNTISEEELKKEFKNNYKEKLTVRHILIEVNDDVKEEDAKKQAEDLIKQLDEVKNDADKLEKKFKDLAYDNSNDTATYKDGGLFKDFSKNGVDEAFYNAAVKLKNGEYTSKPVKSQYGYHVILKVSSKTNKYKDIKETIKKDMAEKMLNEDASLQATTWDKLRKKYKLKINDTDVKKAYKKTVNDAKNKAKESAESSNNAKANKEETKKEETKKED